MDYTKIYNEILNFDAAKKAKLKVPHNPYKFLPGRFCEYLANDLRDVKLVFNTNKKVSTLETLKQIEDPQLASAAAIAYSASRSSILTVPAAKNPKYASLTPLLMMAHKEATGIPYEDWDKEDSHIKYALGPYLTCLVEDSIPFLELTKDQIGTLRVEYLGLSPVISYAGRKVVVDTEDGLGIPIYGSKATGKMLLQTWIANVSLRVPNSMILDPWDWDKVPEAVEEIAVNPAKKEGNLPW